MKPLDFVGATVKLVAEDCYDLPARKVGAEYWTLWQPDPHEVAAIASGGVIKLVVVGDDQPPVRVAVVMPFSVTRGLSR